jgi:maltose O-acetyltransferase
MIVCLTSKIRSAFLWVARLRGRYYSGNYCNYQAPLICNGQGKVSLEEGVGIGYSLAPKAGNGAVILQARPATASISIGARSNLSNNVCIIACKSVSIGKDCLIGDGVLIFDSDFHRTCPIKRRENPNNDAAVSIADNVWLGSRVVILKGVSIGTNSVIAAGSVVTRDIPVNSIAAGNLARVIRRLEGGSAC